MTASVAAVHRHIFPIISRLPPVAASVISFSKAEIARFARPSPIVSTIKAKYRTLFFS